MRKIDQDLFRISHAKSNIEHGTVKLEKEAERLANENHLLKGVLETLIGSAGFALRYSKMGQLDKDGVEKAINNAKKVLKTMEVEG